MSKLTRNISENNSIFTVHLVYNLSPRKNMKRVFIILTTFCFVSLISCTQRNTSNEDKEKQEYAERVKSAFLKGWKAYATYAYGMDAVNPIAQKGHNWYDESLLMTPIDAYSPMRHMVL